MDSTAATTPVAPAYVVQPFRLHPFRALILAPSTVGDPASARAFARPYDRVSARLGAWEASGRLTHDPSPALYLHEYTSDGVTVRGLVGLLDLTSTSVRSPGSTQAVYPHEGVHLEQVREMAERMGEMQVNPAPILLVHRGRAGVRALLDRVQESPPQRQYVDRSGQVHRIWSLRDQEVLTTLDTALAQTSALIADGHHRYAAYLELSDRFPDTPWQAGLVMLVDQSDTPLWLGPIHRVLAGARLDRLLAELTGLDDLEVLAGDRTSCLERLGGRTIALTDGDVWVTLTHRGAPDELAVGVFDEVLLPRWGLPRQRVTFHHNAPDALGKLETATGVAALMPPPSFDAVVALASAGRLLPEKATSFQPKPSLGSFMRDLRDEGPDPS